jgi:hypothetical protein
MANKLVAFFSGFIAGFLKFWGSSYVETALKGLIGGLAGYCGTLIMTWAIKRFKAWKENKK